MSRGRDSAFPAQGLGFIPGQRTGALTPRWKLLQAAAKTEGPSCLNQDPTQINKYIGFFLKNHRHNSHMYFSLHFIKITRF